MAKFFVAIVTCALLVSLAVFLFLALNRNRQLVHDKETLIPFRH